MILNCNMKLFLLGAVISLASAAQDDGPILRVAKQAHRKGGVDDQSSAETGFGGGGGVEHSKYFHYQHLPEHDKYEFGYRRGNDHHVRERYEKAIPHEGHFKTKVRWADKKGGHGEHYWDYNHAGHHDDGEGGYSDPVPAYTDSQRPAPTQRVHQKRQLEVEPTTERRQFSEDVASPIVHSDQKPQPSQDFYAFESDSQEKDGFVKSFEDEIGGIENFEIQKESTKQKRNPQATESQPQTIVKPESRSTKPSAHETFESLSKAQRAGREIQRSGIPQLFFDLESGRVIDESTGKTYMLQPLN